MSWRKWVDEQAPAEGVPIDPRVEYVLRGKAEMYDSPKATRSTQPARQFQIVRRPKRPPVRGLRCLVRPLSTGPSNRSRTLSNQPRKRRLLCAFGPSPIARRMVKPNRASPRTTIARRVAASIVSSNRGVRRPSCWARRTRPACIRSAAERKILSIVLRLCPERISHASMRATPLREAIS